MPRNVAPSGLPTWRRWPAEVVREIVGGWGRGGEEDEEEGWRSEMVVLRRKSWVTAMPMEAKAREVRSQARKVLSVG